MVASLISLASIYEHMFLLARDEGSSGWKMKEWVVFLQFASP